MHDHNHEHEGELDRNPSINKISEVGAMSFKALQKAKSMIKPGVKLLDVAEHVEKYVRDNGFGCAFPLNLSVNNEAAHYTPSLLDEKVFGDKDVVKVDFGASKNGILGDCAATVDLSQNNQKLVECAELALKNAISKVRAGVAVCEIGKVIEDTATSMGFSPIKNLGGHGVEVHDLHATIFIPNYDNNDQDVLEEGQVIAIEPFVTTSRRNLVSESDICEIFGFVGNGSVRSRDARAIQEELFKISSTEPFAARWLSNVVGDKFKLYAGLSDLARAGALERYPILQIPDENAIVAQAEAEVLVQKDGCIILTK